MVLVKVVLAGPPVGAGAHAIQSQPFPGAGEGEWAWPSQAGLGAGAPAKSYGLLQCGAGHTVLLASGGRCSRSLGASNMAQLQARRLARPHQTQPAESASALQASGFACRQGAWGRPVHPRAQARLARRPHVTGAGPGSLCPHLPRAQAPVVGAPASGRIVEEAGILGRGIQHAVTEGGWAQGARVLPQGLQEVSTVAAACVLGGHPEVVLRAHGPGLEDAVLQAGGGQGFTRRARLLRKPNRLGRGYAACRPLQGANKASIAAVGSWWLALLALHCSLIRGEHTSSAAQTPASCIQRQKGDARLQALSSNPPQAATASSLHGVGEEQCEDRLSQDCGAQSRVRKAAMVAAGQPAANLSLHTPWTSQPSAFWAAAPSPAARKGRQRARQRLTDTRSGCPTLSPPLRRAIGALMGMPRSPVCSSSAKRHAAASGRDMLSERGLPSGLRTVFQPKLAICT